MTVRLVSGQNAPVPHGALRFAVAGARDPQDLDISVLVVTENLTAASSDDFVFYNQLETPGVQLRADGVHIDRDGLRPHAKEVLCIASVGTELTHASTGRPLEAVLFDAQETVVADFAIAWNDLHAAVICFELYQRAGHWRVRAVGQGYAGGLQELLPAHGVEVDHGTDANYVATSPIAENPQGVVEPLDPNLAYERIQMIFEDAARSTAALQSARSHAAHRLDAELSDAVADPAARTGAAALSARTLAQQRHDDLVAEAQSRHDIDADQLIDELAGIDSHLPRALASWQALSWRSVPSKPLQADGIRVGEVRAASADRLRVPFCLPLPLRRPLWIDASSSAAAAPVAAALVLRLLAATSPPPILDVIDLTGSLRALTNRLGRLMGGEPVVSHYDVSEKLEGLVRAVDVAVLSTQTGLGGARSPARVVVLSDPEFGLQVDDLALVAALATRGAAARTSLLIVGADESESSDPHLRNIAQFCDHIPTHADVRVRDSWTDNEWFFTAESMPADDDPVTQLLSSFTEP